MTKQKQINKYFNENDRLEKEKLIKGVSKKFNIAESSATTFYYRWKKEFTGSNNCVQKEEKNIEVKEKPKEKQEIKVPHETKPLDVSEEQVFKKPKITITEGKVDYKGKEFYIKDGALVVGEERFKNIDELEEYKKRQLKEFYMQIGEIAEVLEVIS